MNDDKNKKKKTPIVKRPAPKPVAEEAIQPDDPPIVPFKVKMPGKKIVTEPGELSIPKEYRKPPAISRQSFYTPPPDEDTPPELVTTAKTPAPAVSAYQARKAEIERRRQELEAQRTENEKPVEDKNGRLKSAGLGAVQGLADAFSLKHGLVRNWDEFFARTGAGIGGLAGGAINSKWDEQATQNYNRQKIEADMGNLSKEEEQFYDTSKRDADINYQNARPQLERDEMASREKIAAGNNASRETIADARLRSVIEREQRKAVAEGNKFSLQWEDGVLKRIYKDATKKAETVLDDDGTPVTRKVDVPVNVNGFDVTGRDAIAAQSNYNRGAYSSEEQYARDTNNYNQQYSQLNGQLQGAKVELQTINSQITALQGKISSGTAYDADYQQLNALQKSQADLNGKVQQFESQLKTMRPPERVAAPPPPVVTRQGGKYQGLLFANPQALRQHFPNMSDDQIRNIVMSQGGRFQN